MAFFLTRARFWWPGILRALIIVFLAGATVFVAQIEKINSGDTASWGWVEWSKFALPVLIAMAVSLKGFLDDTMQKLRAQNDTAFLAKGQQ